MPSFAVVMVPYSRGADKLLFPSRPRGEEKRKEKKKKKDTGGERFKKKAVCSRSLQPGSRAGSESRCEITGEERERS